MNEMKNKQYKARHVLSKSLLKSTLAASLLLSGFAGAVGTTGAISDFSVVQVAEAASQQQVSNVLEAASTGDNMKENPASDFSYTVNGSSVTIVKYLGSSKDVVIPKLIDGKPVTNIGYNSFRHHNLTSVVIPDSVTNIEDIAFEYNNLTSVVIPDSVTKIGLNAFANNQLKNIFLSDSVTIIGKSAFALNQITNIVIPDSVTSIEGGAFVGNQLTEVILGKGLITIGNGAFARNQITNIVIPDSVTTIEDTAFVSNQLTEVIIGESVNSIGKQAFHDNQLTSVVIPNNVVSIKESAFGYNKINKIIVKSQNVNYGSNVLQYNPTKSTVFNPKDVTINAAIGSTSEVYANNYSHTFNGVDSELQILTATASVEKAEGSKSQADIDASRSLVNALPESANKTALTERLNAVQTVIDASKTSHEEMMAELIDMKAYLLTGEGTRADVLAMKDALNVILADSLTLANESHRTEVAHYAQDVLDIIGLLEVIWEKIASGELAGMDELISQLPESELKDNTQQEVEAAKEPEIDNTLVEAVASVEKAEQSKLQEDVDASRSLVNGLSDGSEKASLIERLDAVQKGIDDAKALAEQIAKATASVTKAEGTKLQADIDAARPLVEALPNGSEKTTLTERLDSIAVSPEGAELLQEAQDAVGMLNDQSTKEQITTAKELVAKLPDSSTKTELNDRISRIEANQKATNAVAQAENRQTNYNISLAEKAVQALREGPLKTELTERIDQLKLNLDAENKVKSAELTKRDPYITDAMDSINKLNESPKKTELTNRMNVIQDTLATEAETALLEEATTHVVLAEQHKRDPYLTSAKDLVSKLIDGTDKTALEARLKAIQDAAPVAPEAPEVDPALLKAAETQVSYAERYKRDPYLTRAQEAVDKLPTSEVKTALEERLNVIFSGASEQIEATKLKTATDSVAKAETASDLVVIEEARSLVNGLKDGEAKQALVDRLDTIEVTESMQFAYDLKVEIDAVTDATIKKVLQEAYTAVGVAKDRQTTTYMTKASTNIKALSQYEETHSEVIEKLATFFTNMQEEIEMQKLITAADKAVELSEKYQRATYYTKAQAAIDGLSKGKAKADLQARLDAAKS
ncbi:leucine-rich repeat protein [Psychrobacillus sp. FSL K6-1464]|uniref:leucine-rich repeat protein n=1 Tax=Psychrobacillus sp. FSL K6-1464 TaxID=2921545 RepID=UPI0030F744C5